jgi:hypothetical protein
MSETTDAGVNDGLVPFLSGPVGPYEDVIISTLTLHGMALKHIG